MSFTNNQRKPKRVWRVLLWVLIAVLLAGGVMGLIKGFVPGMSNLSFRALAGFSSGSNARPFYEVLYGVVMACLELIAAGCLLTRRLWAFRVAAAVLVLNMAGCVVALALGDVFAAVSLVLRALGLYIIHKNTNQA